MTINQINIIGTSLQVPGEPCLWNFSTLAECLDSAMRMRAIYGCVIFCKPEAHHEQI